MYVFNGIPLYNKNNELCGKYYNIGKSHSGWKKPDQGGKYILYDAISIKIPENISYSDRRQSNSCLGWEAGRGGGRYSNKAEVYSLS